VENGAGWLPFLGEAMDSESPSPREVMERSLAGVQDEIAGKVLQHTATRLYNWSRRSASVPGQVVATRNSSPLDVRRPSGLPAKYRWLSMAADTCLAPANPASRAIARIS
jgi:hypothetical protein